MVSLHCYHKWRNFVPPGLGKVALLQLSYYVQPGFGKLTLLPQLSDRVQPGLGKLTLLSKLLFRLYNYGQLGLCKFTLLSLLSLVRLARTSLDCIRAIIIIVFNL